MQIVCIINAIVGVLVVNVLVMVIVYGLNASTNAHIKFVQTLHLTKLLGCVRIVLLGKNFKERGVHL